MQSQLRDLKLISRCRLIIPIVFRLAAFDPIGLTADPTFREVPFVIWTQVEMHLSLISATIPVLRPVIMNLSTNYSSLGPKDSSTGYAISGGTYRLSTLKPSSHISRNNKLRASNPSANVDSGVFPSSSMQSRDVKDRAGLRADSIESHGSEQMIIRKQISWRVERGKARNPE